MARDEEANQTPATRMPSFTAMSEFASEDDTVKMTIGAESLAEAMDDFSDTDEEPDIEWLKELDYDGKGTLKRHDRQCCNYFRE